MQNFDPGMPGWDLVVPVGGASAVYIGDGYYLTANHVDVRALSPSFASRVGGADLKLFRLPDVRDSDFSVAPLPILETALATGADVSMVGFGDGKSHGTDDVSLAGGGVFATRAWIGDPQATCGDSGGGAFYDTTGNGDWALAGIVFAILTSGQGCNQVLPGTTTYSVDLSYHRDEILAQMVSNPEPSAVLLLGLGLLGLPFLARRR